MFLFHGSNVEVEKPRIIISNRMLDFGPGFYTTSDEAQAVRWAKLQTLRRRAGVPSVTKFEWKEFGNEDLFVLQFEKADKDWLKFVTQNRKGIYTGEKYDVVIGPVANDNTMPVINDYMSGIISEETALILLKPQKLSDQYAFLTYKGIEHLQYMEGKIYE